MEKLYFDLSSLTVENTGRIELSHPALVELNESYLDVISGGVAYDPYEESKNEQCTNGSNLCSGSSNTKQCTNSGDLCITVNTKC